jgi:hypothetical protein
MSMGHSPLSGRLYLLKTIPLRRLEVHIGTYYSMCINLTKDRLFAKSGRESFFVSEWGGRHFFAKGIAKQSKER